MAHLKVSSGPAQPSSRKDRWSRCLVGKSLPMLALRRSISKVVKVANLAATSAPILITGETGTGKELVAHLIHEKSSRAAGPFVAVNCAALPESLFHAEVFGYEKGAFTNANRDNAGRIEAAHGGTLFLDEIGDLSLDMQVVLLRFLEGGCFERLGSTQSIEADVCVIAATHTDLEAACRDGRFREDLYYRLNALQLRIPPLRDRGNDVIAIAEQFIAGRARQLHLREHSLSPDAMESLRCHGWPGNVRELRNRILQAQVMCENRELCPQDLGLRPPGQPARSGGAEKPGSLHQCRWTAEHQAIEHALECCKGDVEAAAASLDISRAQLYRLINDHGLQHRRH